MRLRGLLAVGAVGVLAIAAAAGAGAQGAPTFPESLDREALLLWLQRETDISPQRVVAVTPQAITAVVSTFPAGGGQGPRVVIRAEALSPETHARTGALSWHVSLNADCKGRRIRLGETTGYGQRNLLGERNVLRTAETAWRTPEPGTALEYGWRAACDPAFQGPFGGTALDMAKPDVAQSDAAPPPEPAPTPAPAPDAPSSTPAAQGAPPSAPQPAPGAAGPRTAGPVVQVGAAPSEAEARALISAVEARLDGRATWVESARVGGRVWRRALVGGFSDQADAASFCAGLKAAGHDCFVRQARRR